MYYLSNSLLLASTIITSTLVVSAPSELFKSRLTIPLHRRNIRRQGTRTGLASVEPLPYDPGYQAQQWIAPVILGGYQADLLIDTGSNDLWVYGPQAPNPNGRNVYNPNVSSTSSMANGEHFHAGYAGPDFFASGPVAIDSVAIGGVTVPKLDIGLADTLGSAMITQTQHCDGILGLGFQSANSISPDSSPTFMEAALPYLDQPVFTVNVKGDDSGTLGFGFVDHTAYVGDLISVPVDNATSRTWTVDGVGYGIGNTSLVQQMEFDTGAYTTTVDPTIAGATGLTSPAPLSPLMTRME